MRLIDADKLIEELTIKSVSKDAHIISVANAVVNFVNNQPTAYDIGKVVEELKKSSKWVNETNEYGDDDGNDYIPLSNAIEIVKQGGVSDDVCEWEHSPTDNNVIRPFHHKDVIGMYEDVLCKFPYCSVCGKKIKIVGD